MQATLQYAQSCDAQDPLRSYREQFHFPIQDSGEPYLYFCGNSLGLQPKRTAQFVEQEMGNWRKRGVRGHFQGDTPWTQYHELLTERMAKIVGAKPIEVVVMNTLTVNLHLLMASFYRPTKTRYKILMEGDAFPSDRHVVGSQLHFHGYNDDALIALEAREGETLLRQEDIEAVIEQHGHEIALILMGCPNYYTGQVVDMKRIATLGHAKGCKVGFDLAHAAGNIPLELHDSGIDFGAWCTYKYLNSGPGAISGCFVHERHANNPDLPRFAGWWGHPMESRFNMRMGFQPIAGAEGWQLSNPPILSLTGVNASLEMFDEVGMPALRKKSQQLTGYLEFLIQNLNNEHINIITPSATEERGCQLSVQVNNADRSLYEAISSKGIITDWRNPDVIRIAPAPIYNSFEDVYRFVEILKECL